MALLVLIGIVPFMAMGDGHFPVNGVSEEIKTERAFVGFIESGVSGTILPVQNSLAILYFSNLFWRYIEQCSLIGIPLARENYTSAECIRSFSFTGVYRWNPNRELIGRICLNHARRDVMFIAKQYIQSRFFTHVLRVHRHMDRLFRSYFSETEILRVKPCSVGDHGSSLVFGDPLVNEGESDHSSESRKRSDPIKPNGYPELPFPVVPLCGAVLFIVGGWAGSRGSENRPLWLYIGGWLIAVWGGTIFMLWLIPYLAAILPVTRH